MNITLRQVEVFVAVATELHFGRAAERLHISQATASQEVRRLEVALGLRLFDRSTRSASLTPAGETILIESRALLRSADQLTERARLFQDEHLRRLRVIVSPSVVNRLLPAVMSAAEQRFPEVRIEDVAVETGAVADRVVSDRGDVGIGRFLDAPSGYQKETIAEEELMVAVSDGYALAAPDRIDLSALHDLPLLLWPREQAPRYYDYLMQVCEDRGLTPLILVSPPRIVGSRLYVISESRAFSLVPRSTVPYLPHGLTGVSMVRPATAPLEMIYRTVDPRPAVAPFLELIRETGARIASGEPSDAAERRG